MPLSVPEFWSLVEESRLLSADLCADLRRRWRDVKGAAESGSPRTLAEWLIAEDELTRYQAKLLLARQPGPFLYGEYVVAKRLRRGGLTDCFQAVHAPTHFPVTLRFVRGTALDPMIRLEQVQHLFLGMRRTEVGVLPFREWVDCGAYQFAVFDRAEGEPVAATVAQRGKLDGATACRVLYQAATGLVDLHRRGMAHGAVRPETIWVGNDERVVLLPRQLSESWSVLLDETSWLSGGSDPLAIGIAQYTAPEQAGRRARATASGDVYALGCVLYVLLAGKPPFSGASVEEIVQQHAVERVPPLRRRSVSPKLIDLLHHLLAKDVGQRPGNASEVVDALTRVAAAADIALPSPQRSEDCESEVTSRARHAYSEWLSRRQTANEVARAAPTVPDSGSGQSDPDRPGKPAPGASAASPGHVPHVHPRHEALSSKAARYRRGSRRAVDWLTVAGAVILALATAVALNYWGAGGGEKRLAEEKEQEWEGNGSESRPLDAHGSENRATLWASPTDGDAISTRHLAPGTQAVLSMRIADLAAHPEGERIFAAIGPRLRQLLDSLPAVTGLGPSEISRLTIGWEGVGPPGWQSLNLVLELNGGLGITRSEVRARFQDAQQVQVEGEPVVLREDVAYWMPSAGETGLVVIADVEQMSRIIRQGSVPPLLPHDVDRLLAETDAKRHVTFLLPPRLLWGDGRDLLSGHAAVLLEPLQWFLGEQTRAVGLSLHWGEDFFVEMQAIAAAEVPPWELAERLQSRLQQLPERVESRLPNGQVHPYGRQVLARFPKMLHTVSENTRWAAGPNRAVLRCYLPLPAGHNLLMASEIALAEIYVAGTRGPRPGATHPQTLDERLAKVTSLRFSRDTLEAALDMLSADIGVPIKILGRDLQLEGITKNQSLALDLHNRPAREILVEILRRANADKAAPSTSDPRQSLVFTVQASENGQKTIYITTRQAAQQRGWMLAEEFLDVP